MDNILRGTEVHVGGNAADVAAALLSLKERGQRHALGTRLCHLALAVFSLVAFGLLLFREPWWFGVLAAVSIFFYYLPTTFDPELADDERLEFAIALVSSMSKNKTLSLWVELNVYECMAPDSREALSSGRVFEKWKLPWLRLEVDGRTLHGELRAQRVEDGLKMLDELVEMEVTDGDKALVVNLAEENAWAHLTEFCRGVLPLDVREE